MDKKLQVFVSSTYTDLKEERQAAVEAILDAGHIPAGMELFKPGNESQLKTIYKWIDESDVYLLILGGRYGSIEPKSGKSYTQIEYEYALSKNIPVFAVVLSESFLTTKINLLKLSDVVEQNFSDKYQNFKSLVMSKIIRMVDDCKDIKIVIHSALHEFINEYDLIGWVKGTTINNDPELVTRIEFLETLNNNLRSQIRSPNNKVFGIFTSSELISILSSVNICDKLLGFMRDYDEKQILEFQKWDLYNANALDFFYALFQFLSLGIPNQFFNINKNNTIVMTIALECASVLISCDLIELANIETIQLTENAKKFYAQLLSDNYIPSIDLLPSLIKLADIVN